MRVTGLDDRTYEGTPLQIVKGMRDRLPLTRGDTVSEYVKLVVDAVYQSEGIVLRVEGENDEAIATSLVEELIRHNIVTRH